MGTFFTNLHVRGKSRKAVADTLRDLLTEPAHVSSSKGRWVSVFPEETEKQDDSITRIGAELSRRLNTPVLAQIVHDSDIFFYWLWQNGELLDEYNSNPHYFKDDPNAEKLRGKPDVILPIAKSEVTVEQIEHALATASRFAENGMWEFTALLGIDEARACTGYSQWGEDSDEDPEEHGIIRVDAIPTKQRTQEELNTSLRQALLEYDRAASKALIDAGADINSPMRGGRLPLVSAAYFCDIDAARFLLDVGADINARSPLGMGWDFYELDEELTPLMAACQTSREHPTEQWEMVAFLLASGADVHTRSTFGRTVLQVTYPMLDWQSHQGRIGRYAPEDVLRAAAVNTAKVVAMLREAGATE